MGAQITAEMTPGCSIERACEDACRIANLLGCDVRFSFNGVECLALPQTLAADLVENWDYQRTRKLIAPMDKRFATSNKRKVS